MVAEARKLAEKIKKRGGELVGATANLVDIVWGADRPSRPNEKVTVLDIRFSGKNHREKIGDLRKELEKQNSAGFVVCEFPRLALGRLLFQNLLLMHLEYSRLR